MTEITNLPKFKINYTEKIISFKDIVLDLKLESLQILGYLIEHSNRRVSISELQSKFGLNKIQIEYRIKLIKLQLGEYKNIIYSPTNILNRFEKTFILKTGLY